jgi:hypothetical protein
MDKSVAATLAGIERARILAEEARRIAEDTRATLESASKLVRLEPFPLDVLTDAPSLISLLPPSVASEQQPRINVLRVASRSFRDTTINTP